MKKKKNVGIKQEVQKFDIVYLIKKDANIFFNEKKRVQG